MREQSTKKLFAKQPVGASAQAIMFGLCLSQSIIPDLVATV